jgi:hypothetical protein
MTGEFNHSSLFLKSLSALEKAKGEETHVNKQASHQAPGYADIIIVNMYLSKPLTQQGGTIRSCRVRKILSYEQKLLTDTSEYDGHVR